MIKNKKSNFWIIIIVSVDSLNVSGLSFRAVEYAHCFSAVE